MNLRHLALWLLVLVHFAVGAQPAKPSTQVEFDRAAHASLRTIALLSIDEPRKYVIEGSGRNPLLLFGPIGGAIAGAQLHPYAKALADKKIAIASSLFANLKAELEAEGYKVIPAESPEVPATDVRKDTVGPVPGADATLIVTLPINGFMLSESKDSYQPLLVVVARLIAPGHGEPLYRKGFAVGLKAKTGDGGGRFLKSDAKYSGDANAIIQRAEETSVGLIAAHKEMAKRIASDLAPAR